MLTPPHELLEVGHILPVWIHLCDRAYVPCGDAALKPCTEEGGGAALWGEKAPPVERALMLLAAQVSRNRPREKGAGAVRWKNCPALMSAWQRSLHGASQHVRSREGSHAERLRRAEEDQPEALPNPGGQGAHGAEPEPRGIPGTAAMAHRLCTSPKMPRRSLRFIADKWTKW